MIEYLKDNRLPSETGGKTETTVLMEQEREDERVLLRESKLPLLMNSSLKYIKFRDKPAVTEYRRW